MIRKMEKSDIETVAAIWLDTNKKAHNFISPQYWENNFEYVKELLLQSEIYVYENEQAIYGFIGLNEEYIEGIFVSDDRQSKGIGKALLDFVKQNRNTLCLHVYQKNLKAIHFYKREGFIVQKEELDEATGEKEYTMMWETKL